MEELTIKHDLDKRMINVKFDNYDFNFSEAQFAKFTILHLKTGKKMSKILIDNYHSTLLGS